MELTDSEEKILSGEMGPGLQKAMEIVVALGKIYGAEDLVAIKSAQIAGVSYKNLGDEGLDFLDTWAKEGAKVKVKATLNPAGMDLCNWRPLGFSEDFAEKQLQVVRAYEKMGIQTTCTCTPYLVGNLPGFKEHIAWSESSAVSYANSVLGARTNREGGPSALAAAIIGKTANYGMHLEDNRISNFLVDVKCPVDSVSDFGALGYIVGKEAGNRVPFFRGIHKASPEGLKGLGGAMAASGSVALYHMEAVTPEAKKKNMLSEDYETLTIEDLRPGYEGLSSDTNEIDLVAIGCPHASIEEIAQVAGMLGNRKVKSALWITTSSEVKKLADKKGLLTKIEKSGGHIVADTCIVVAPIAELGFRSIATNAGKAAFYTPSHCKAKTRFGNLEKCIETAVNGRWI